MVHVFFFLILALVKQRQVNFCMLKASLVYIVPGPLMNGSWRTTSEFDL